MNIQQRPMANEAVRMARSSTARSFLITLLCALLLGCNSGRMTVAPAPAGYSVSVTPARISTTLGTQHLLTVNVVSSGFAGTVGLTVSGMPASWAGGLTPLSTVALTDGGSASTTLIVRIATDAEAADTGAVITVQGDASTGARAASAVFTVVNENVVHIADGTGSGPHWGALAGKVLNLAAGSTLTIVNDDASAHRIHTGNRIPGLLEQPTAMATGGAYRATVGVGEDSVSCETHGSETGSFLVRVHPLKGARTWHG